MAGRVPVRTPYGVGQLWQVFSDRVGVLLYSRPAVMTFVHPSEVMSEAAA
jgi:hypothetical protein